MAKKKQKMIYSEVGVVWICRQCGSYNLDLIDWSDHECINCGSRLFAKAEAQEILIKRPK